MFHPSQWWHLRNPFRPSWGEPYAQIAARMRAAVADAVTAATGHEAVLISHQLPIWTVRQSFAGRRLWHDPRRRQCAVASVTSLHFEDGRFVRSTYAEPAADLVSAAPGRGA